MKRKGFTLLELLITVIIIGVLVTLGRVSYTGIREEALDKEARANLKLIIAAQKIYRMEVGAYYPVAGGTISNMVSINTNLRLLLTTLANRSWDYITTASAISTCAQATRILGGRNWKMSNSDTAPVSGATCP